MIQHVTETAWPESVDCIYKMNAVYIQPSDNYSSNNEDNTLKIGTEPGGYFYIETKRWAFDDINELINILKDFKNKIKFADESSGNTN